MDSVKETGTNTCCLKIELTATSKIEGHFIYEVCYLDEGELKSVPIVASSIVGVLECIEPYINKGLSENQVSFMVGTEDTIISRKKK